MSRRAGMLMGCMPVLGLFALVLMDSSVPANQSVTAPDPGHAAEPDPVALEQAAQPAGDFETDPVEMTRPDRPVAGPAARALSLDPQTWNQATESYSETEDREMAGLMHQSLWSPFRSQWAAQGFARRLALATEVPVEVLNEAPGVYRVVFRYHDEAERRMHLQRIETVTGLEPGP